MMIMLFIIISFAVFLLGVAAWWKRRVASRKSKPGTVEGESVYVGLLFFRVPFAAVLW
jgi:uncharacterized iron-regulated membrane protein